MEAPQVKIGYREVQLLKTETLGIGSYGSVCKAMCDQLVCAAKIIHPLLFDPNTHQQISAQKEHRLPIRRFELECAFLKDIRHPNIVQYLGMSCDPETGLPVLLMELMDESLTHFLENSNGPIPYHVQLTICLDITRALSFLHSNGIIHRDLSSNNILLIGKSRAKLTDFGMAKLHGLDRGRSNTTCPGTEVYMPPEAIDKLSVYTEKGDVFSFGVNVIQILTRKFPDPSVRSQVVPIKDPRFPSGQIRVFVPEIERRQNHISIVDPIHPLLQTALDCLKDQDFERPSANELCRVLITLKDSRESKESQSDIPSLTSGTVAERDRQITELRQLLHSQQQQQEEQLQSSQQTLEARQREIQRLRQDLSSTVYSNRQLREQVLSLQARAQHKDQIIGGQTKDNEIQQIHKQVEELSLGTSLKARHLSASGKTEKHNSQASIKRSLNLKWSKGKNAPCKMFRLTDAVVKGGVAYFKPNTTRLVYAYHSTTATWSQLPVCPTKNPALAIVNDLLTTIGGELVGKGTDVLFSLLGQGRYAEWSKIFPAMPTKREGAAAVSTETTLIVAGGVGDGVNRLKTVEVMNTDTLQWTTAANLPEPHSCYSLTVCGENLYMLGGWDLYAPTRSVVSCSLSALFQSCNSPPTQPEMSSPPMSPKIQVWSKLSDLPVTSSTAVSLKGQLLAIGGSEPHTGSTMTAAYAYDPIENEWKIIGQLRTPRQLCFVVVLPDDKLMVVGGRTSAKTNSATDSVELAVPV